MSYSAFLSHTPKGLEKSELSLSPTCYPQSQPGPQAYSFADWIASIWGRRKVISRDF